MDRYILSRYTTFLQSGLTPSRLQHSIGVLQVMEELASVYSLDVQTAGITGLLHDAVKDLSSTQQMCLINEADIRIEHPCERDYVLYMHGPVSAYYIHKELGVSEPHILAAIRMHCYTAMGENSNTNLTWCLRFSDILEPNRIYDVPWFRDGIPRLKSAVYAGRLGEAAFLQTGWIINMWEEKGFPVHPNLRQIHQEFSILMNLDDTFLE